MNNQVTNWIDFWDHQKVMDDPSWQKNTELLIEGSQSFFAFDAEDTVLDVGSGPGFLADKIANKVKEVYCVDTSETYVTQGKKRLSNQENVNIDLLRDDYLDFTLLKGKQFSKILCASVIQYYKNLEEVEKLIVEMRKLAKPGAKLLIVDISVEHSTLKDIVGLLTTAWRKDYFLKIISFIVKSFSGEYSHIRKQLGLLTIHKSDLDNIVKKNNLIAEWRDDILTLNKSRRHLLIQF